MSQLIQNSCSLRAQAVLALIRLLISGETDSQPNLGMSPFNTEHGDGIHLNETVSGRAVNFIGDNRGDGFILTVGYQEDYDFPAYTSKPSVKCRTFAHGKADDVAVSALNWLFFGVPVEKASAP